MIAATESRKNRHYPRCSALPRPLNPDVDAPLKITVPRMVFLKSGLPCPHMGIMLPTLASQRTPWMHLSSYASTPRLRSRIEQLQQYVNPATALSIKVEVEIDPCGKQKMISMHTAWEAIFFRVPHTSRRQTTAVTLNTHGLSEATFFTRAAPIAVSPTQLVGRQFLISRALSYSSFATPWYC